MSISSKLWNHCNKAAPLTASGCSNGAAGIHSSAPGNGRCAAVTRSISFDDSIGWLSLTNDADGHGRHENDVLCMGITPDVLDEHDLDGGDLSWIGLIPSASTHSART